MQGIDQAASFRLGDRDVKRLGYGPHVTNQIICEALQGFILLGQIVEQVSGLGYDDYARRNIFAPVDMASTGNQLESAVLSRRAVSYMGSGARLKSADETLPLNGTAAGGGYATVGDFNRFVDGLTSRRLLRSETLKRLIHGGVRMADGQFAGFDFGGTMTGTGRFHRAWRRRAGGERFAAALPEQLRHGDRSGQPRSRCRRKHRDVRRASIACRLSTGRRRGRPWSKMIVGRSTTSRKLLVRNPPHRGGITRLSGRLIRSCEPFYFRRVLLNARPGTYALDMDPISARIQSSRL